MKTTIDIEKKLHETLFEKLDRTKYFDLNNPSLQRLDLFQFALALGIDKGERTPLKNRFGLVRTESVDKAMPFFRSVYFQEFLKFDTEKVDSIVEMDEGFYVVEEFANTGFNEIKKIMQEETNDFNLALLLINKCDELFDEYNIQ